MREVIEHFGMGFSETIGCIGIISLLITFLNDGGIVKNIIWNYLQGLCG